MDIRDFLTLVYDFGFFLLNHKITFKVIEHTHVVSVLFGGFNEAARAVELRVAREYNDVHAEKSGVEGNARPCKNGVKDA